MDGMSKTDYPAPGPDLDALVAEKVMGDVSRTFRTPDPDDAHDLGQAPTLVIGDVLFTMVCRSNAVVVNVSSKDYRCPSCRKTINTREFPASPRPYSTDIAAAWEVVEKMGLWRGFDFIVWRPTSDARGMKPEYIWEAGWYEVGYEGPETRAVGYADTAPHAICLAALKAVER